MTSRAFASSGLTDKQLEEISKYDARLAGQMRVARDKGLSVSWRDLDEIDLQKNWQSVRSVSAIGSGAKQDIGDADAKPRIAASATSASALKLPQW
eukprot:CAMPEP_0169114556 /NCGR_PEP_ID=MMETSP1015-20121227/28820_1 /TAXON_ID=342587 /ORGANISM="Karlodinium micrum, Strain CCMP2283" /LENGTH=95 /DNA_ID=CAMNT_0009176845 /DNA_START=167 /DNA_END=451 /DNA_ORIENTATION=-